MRNLSAPKGGKPVKFFHQFIKSFRAFFESGHNKEFRKLKDFIAS